MVTLAGGGHSESPGQGLGSSVVMSRRSEDPCDAGTLGKRPINTPLKRGRCNTLPPAILPNVGDHFHVRGPVIPELKTSHADKRSRKINKSKDAEAMRVVLHAHLEKVVHVLGRPSPSRPGHVWIVAQNLQQGRSVIFNERTREHVRAWHALPSEWQR